MKTRLALAGAAVALAAAPFAATPAQATCGPVVVEACRVVCRVPHPAVVSLCSIL